MADGRPGAGLFLWPEMRLLCPQSQAHRPPPAPCAGPTTGASFLLGAARWPCSAGPEPLAETPPVLALDVVD